MVVTECDLLTMERAEYKAIIPWANSSYEYIWNQHIIHLQLERVRCSLINEQVTVGLWDSINTYDSV